MTKKRLVWHYTDQKFLQTGLQNSGVWYKVMYKKPLEDELEPEWQAFRCCGNVEVELYCCYNLAKALKACELDRNKNEDSD